MLRVREKKMKILIEESDCYDGQGAGYRAQFNLRAQGKARKENKRQQSRRPICFLATTPVHFNNTSPLLILPHCTLPPFRPSQQQQQNTNNGLPNVGRYVLQGRHRRSRRPVGRRRKGKALRHPLPGSRCLCPLPGNFLFTLDDSTRFCLVVLFLLIQWHNYYQQAV